MFNQKVIKFAGVSVLSIRFSKKLRVHCRGRGLGPRLIFFPNRRDTVNFTCVYHRLSKVHKHVLEHHNLNVRRFITGLNNPLHSIKDGC